MSRQQTVQPNVGTVRDKNGNLVDHLRSMQQMERETQETLSKFMSALSHRNETDYASLLEDKISELQQAESENMRLRSEMDSYEDRIEQLQKNEDRILKEKSQIQDEKLRAGKAATQADQIIKNLQSQMRTMEQKHAQDIDVKASMLRNLEEENVRSKVHSDEARTRLEAFTHETAELHSAMASLHGEIAAQQRELDEAKERDQRNARQKKELNVRLDEKEAELGRLKGDRRNLEARVTDMEKKLNDAAMRDDQVQQEGKTQVDALVRERDNVSGSLAKMSHKLRQQTETSKELNSAMNRMRIELSNAQESSVRESARAEAAIRDVQSLQIVVSSLERSKTEADAMVQRMEQDKLGVGSDLTQANERIASLLAEQRKLTASTDKLERQRTELTVELSCRSKELEGLKKNHEAAQVDLEDARARYDTERLGKERALERIGGLEGDLDRAKSELREHVENIESQARQLRESERMREQALETSRAQQRENANRIIEFSQKNAKLSSELSSKDDEIQALRRTRQDEHSRGVESSKERDDAKNQYLATKVRLQALEDEHELSVAKYEASKAENDQLRQHLKQEIKTREATITELLEKHDETVAQLTSRLEAEAEEKASIAEATRKQTEEKLNRAIAKEKENHKEQLSLLDADRQSDSEVQRARLATLAKAMEGLQTELREESSKNANLAQELSVLKDLADVGNTEMQERVNYVERERGRERSRLEGQLSDIKEQLRQQLEVKQQRDQLMNSVEQQLTREREAKFAAMQRVRAAEDEANSLTNQVDTLNEESSTQKKELRNFERKLAVAIQSKDAEIVRLTRRNEVLGEAVTRLTSSSQGSAPSSREGSVSKSLNKFFTSGIAVSPNGEQHLDSMASLEVSSSPVTTGVESTVSVASSEPRKEIVPSSFYELFSPQRTSTAPSSNKANDLHVNSCKKENNNRVQSADAVLTEQEVEGRDILVNRFPSPPPSEKNTSSPPPVSIPNANNEDFNLEDLVREAVLIGDEEAREDKGELLPLTPPAATFSNNSGIENSEDGSGGFKERLQATVELGKGIQLPFSPKRASSAPIARSVGLETDKENTVQYQKVAMSSKIPKVSSTKSSDRIKRATEFLKTRRSTSASTSKHATPPAKKGPVF